MKYYVVLAGLNYNSSFCFSEVGKFYKTKKEAKEVIKKKGYNVLLCEIRKVEYKIQLAELSYDLSQWKDEKGNKRYRTIKEAKAAITLQKYSPMFCRVVIAI